jgi:putative membrane protein
MLDTLIKFVLTAVAVIIVSYLLPGVAVEGFFTAFILAVLLALLNATVKPVLIVLTIPMTFLTLGLFLLVINAIVILLADWILPGFDVVNFWWALLFSLLLSLTEALLRDISRFKSKPEHQK